MPFYITLNINSLIDNLLKHITPNHDIPKANMIYHGFWQQVFITLNVDIPGRCWTGIFERHSGFLV